jgi:hypothetical protein
MADWRALHNFEFQKAPQCFDQCAAENQILKETTMFRKIALSAVTAALVFGSVSAGMAKDYDDIMKDSGRYIDMNGVPFPYSQYSPSGQARDARAQSVNHARAAAHAHRRLR